LTPPIKRALRGEYFVPIFKFMDNLSHIPDWLWGIIKPILRLFGQRRLAEITEA